MKIHKRSNYNKWNHKEIAIFFERLELYLDSGLTIDMALRLCHGGISPAHRVAIESLLHHIESGQTLSQGLEIYLRLSKMNSGMISHGETSGNLRSAISIVRNSIEKQDELKKKCIGAMIYPGVIAAFCVVFVVGLMEVVMPQIVPMLNGLHTTLPLVSRVMITCSDLVTHYGLYGFIALLIILIVFIILYRRSDTWRYMVQMLTGKIPLIGRMIVDFNIVYLLRSIGSLVESGLSVSKAFSDSVSTIAYIPIYKSVQPEIRKLDSGYPLDKALRSIPSIQQYVLALVSAGASSGTLGVSLLRAASILERDMDHSLKKITLLIEPLMMIAMGVIVGAIALSILMPIYDLSKTLQH